MGVAAISKCYGHVLYLTLLKKQFPDAEIVTRYLGSNQNEQLFAFIQVSYSSGCSRNMDSITMAHGERERMSTVHCP